MCCVTACRTPGTPACIPATSPPQWSWVCTGAPPLRYGSSLPPTQCTRQRVEPKVRASPPFPAPCVPSLPSRHRHGRFEQRPSLVPYMGGGNAVTGRMVTNSSTEWLPAKTSSPHGTLGCHQSAGRKPQHPCANSAIHVLPLPSPPYAPLLSPNVLRRVGTSPRTLGGGTSTAAGFSRLPCLRMGFQGIGALSGAYYSPTPPQCATLTTYVHSGRMCVCVCVQVGTPVSRDLHCDTSGHVSSAAGS